MNTYTIKYQSIENGTEHYSEMQGANEVDALKKFSNQIGDAYRMVYAEEIKADNGDIHSGSCHYCGMATKSWGFFDEPVCDECQ